MYVYVLGLFQQMRDDKKWGQTQMGNKVCFINSQVTPQIHISEYFSVLSRKALDTLSSSGLLKYSNETVWGGAELLGFTCICNTSRFTFKVKYEVGSSENAL